MTVSGGLPGVAEVSAETELRTAVQHENEKTHILFIAGACLNIVIF